MKPINTSKYSTKGVIYMKEMFYHPTKIDIKENVKQIYQSMKKEDLVKTATEFSRFILQKSPRYYSMIIANEVQDFSVDALSWLVSQLDFIRLDNQNNPQINRLYENAVRLLDKRVRQVYIPNNYFKISLPLKEN